MGDSALYNSTGSWNIAIGYEAGYQISTGSNNIDIGHQGISNDSNTIRIGTSGTHSTTFIAGINGVNIASGSTVLINSNGELGTLQSSARYKDEVRDMGNASGALMSLRPVTFRYKRATEDGSRPLQYGLIGEEVANVYPDLVVYGLDGKVESVQYHELPALLLNELQKQHRLVDKQEQELEEAQRAIEAQKLEIQALQLQMKAVGIALSMSAGSIGKESTIAKQ